MVKISLNKESLKRDFGDSPQLTKWVLDSGEACHMTPEVSNFVPVLLIETVIYIKVVDENYITAKKTGRVQINIHDDNGELLIATLCYILFVSELCDHYVNEFGT